MDCVQHQIVEEISIQNFCLFLFDDENEWVCKEKGKDKLTFDVEDLDENTFGTQSVFFQKIYKS